MSQHSVSWHIIGKYMALFSLYSAAVEYSTLSQGRLLVTSASKKSVADNIAILLPEAFRLNTSKPHI
jgi:hypothetical protein